MNMLEHATSPWYS